MPLKQDFPESGKAPHFQLATLSGDPFYLSITMISSTAKFHKAPWGKLLIWISVLTTVMLILVPILVPRSNDPRLQWTTAVSIGLPLIILGSSVLFVVRGYVIGDGTLGIRRLFWTTQIPLGALISAEVTPDAMKRSVRTFGNGGIFSITGYYWSKPLGSYRAYVTDLKRTVVLRFPDKRIVVSPEHPESFVADCLAAVNEVNQRSL